MMLRLFRFSQHRVSFNKQDSAMQIPDTDTPLILLALGVAMFHVPDPERVAMEELERRIQALRGTDFEQINKDNTMSTNKQVTDDEIELAKCEMGLIDASWIEPMRRALVQFAAGSEGWHSAVLAECTSIGACYQESDPAKTMANLIDWHRKDAVWHHEQEEAGRVAASQPVPDIANGLKFVIDWLEGGKDPLLAAKELRGLVAASPAPVSQPIPSQDEVELMARDMCQREELVWAGFRKDSNDLYTIPDISPSVYKLVIGALKAFSFPQVTPITNHAAEPAPPAEMAKHGELDPRTAVETARKMVAYCQSFNGQKWGGVDESVDRQNLATALDNLEETASMLLNMADRVHGIQIARPVAQKADAPVASVHIYENAIGQREIAFQDGEDHQCRHTLSTGHHKLYTTPQAPAPTYAERLDASEIASLIVRSVCETDPADPADGHTVCISTGDLTSIIELHIQAMDAKDAA